MPFILSPKLASFYSNLLNKKEVNTFERYHNDGIKIGINSPECLDEIFWIKTFPFDSTKHTEKLIDENLMKAYSYLLNSFSELEGKRLMLIKNNNNHIRLHSMSDYFNDSIFLVLYRNPIYHANSLYKQNKNFKEIQTNDPFVLEFMNLIGHYEFGNNLKPFIYKSENQLSLEKYNNNYLEYWLVQWINTYSWILDSNLITRKNILLISYEKLCHDDSLYINLCDHIGITNKTLNCKFLSSNVDDNQIKKIDNYDLISRAFKIYEELNNYAF